MAALSDGRLGCYRCAYVWRPIRQARPQVCPRCKSRYWDVPLLRSVRAGRGPGIEEILLPRRRAILRAAERHGFGHVRVFGSVRRNEASSTSDVDLLVERKEGTSLLDRAGLLVELETILGRTVDLVPEESLHWLIRPQVLFEAVPL